MDLRMLIRIDSWSICCPFSQLEKPLWPSFSHELGRELTLEDTGTPQCTS